MSISTDTAVDIQAVLERIHYLEYLDGQLSALGYETRGFLFVLFVIAVLVPTMIISRRSKSARVKLVYKGSVVTSLVLCGVGMYLQLIHQADPNNVASFSKIAAVFTERSPSSLVEKLSKGDGHLTELEYQMALGALRVNIKDALEIQKEILDRITFKESGELEKIRKEIFSKAVAAVKDGSATPEQMAVAIQGDIKSDGR